MNLLTRDTKELIFLYGLGGIQCYLKNFSNLSSFISPEKKGLAKSSLTGILGEKIFKHTHIISIKLGGFMKVSKLALGLVSPMLLTACSEMMDNEVVASTLSNAAAVCNADNNNDVWFSSKDNAYFSCQNGSWHKTEVVASVRTPEEASGKIEVPNAEKNYAEMPQIPMSCDIDGDKYKITKDWSVYQCQYGLWVLVAEDWDVGPVMSSSSSYNPNHGNHLYLPNAMWRGDESIYQIETGMDNGSETSGYWFSFSDDADGGMSQIIWPVNIGNDYSEFALDPIIDYCEGLCGTYELNKGTLTFAPFAGVGFNVAGEDDYGMPVSADISSWGGICVTYSADIPVKLELVMDDPHEAELDFDHPIVLMPKAITDAQKCYDWSRFKQEGWGSGKITGEDASQKTASIRFSFAGPSGSKGKFNILSIGRYNENSNSTPIQSSSSSHEELSVQPCFTKDDMFCHGENNVVNTGFKNNQAGYLFEYNDEIDGGKSAFIWPVELDKKSDNAYAPIIDHCDGLCGSLLLDRGTMYYDPFTSIGFRVAGIDKSGEPISADISNWGGICLSYQSDAAISMEIGYDEANEAEVGFDVPFVSLPKASNGTQKCFTWSQFKQAGWGTKKIAPEDNAKNVTAIRIKFQAKTGTTANFRIDAVSKYNTVYPPVQSKGFFWNGTESVYQIDTGLDYGMEDSGYWYEFGTDSKKTFIKWPAEKGNEYSEDAMDNIIEHCGGVCGTVTTKKTLFGNTSQKVGIAFNVAGTDEIGSVMTADASSWNGICVTYTASEAFSMELSMGDLDEVLNNDLPAVTIPKAASEAKVCYAWDQFKGSKWSQVSTDFAENLASVRFAFTPAKNKNINFNIIEVSSNN